jgi:hypothetical protein
VATHEQGTGRAYHSEHSDHDRIRIAAASSDPTRPALSSVYSVHDGFGLPSASISPAVWHHLHTGRSGGTSRHANHIALAMFHSSRLVLRRLKACSSLRAWPSRVSMNLPSPRPAAQLSSVIQMGVSESSFRASTLRMSRI